MTLTHNRVTTSSAPASSVNSLPCVLLPRMSLAQSLQNYDRSGPQFRKNRRIRIYLYFDGATGNWAPFFCVRIYKLLYNKYRNLCIFKRECTDVRVCLRFMVSAGNPKVGCQVRRTERSSILPTRGHENNWVSDGIGIHVALRTQILGVRVPSRPTKTIQTTRLFRLLNIK